MATKVIMPKQGLQMTEGNITRWIVREGEQATAEQPLFEMETDKLTIEIMAPATGTLLRILQQEGAVVPITQTIAVIGQTGEDITALLQEAGVAAPEKPAATTADTLPGSDTSTSGQTMAAVLPGSDAASAAPVSGGRVFVTPRARMRADESGMDLNRIAGSGPDGLVIERDILDALMDAAKSPKATPVARRLAELNAVDLQRVPGMGPGGKIMKADVQAALAGQPEAAAVASQTIAPASASSSAPATSATADRAPRGERLVPMSAMRKVIAERMSQSLHTMAQANHRMKVDMTEVIRFREKLKADNVKVTFTDIFVKCVAKALTEFPIVNASLTDQGILMKEYVNMGLAVAVPNGLIVPVIKDADLLSLPEIAAVSAALIEKTKKGTLTPDEYSGGTFTISNLGMFDVDEFTAIVNPPESAILAIGKIDRVPVVEGDQVVIRPILVLSLSYDHRTIDGAPAAQFLQRIKQILQNPYLLI
jgi:pyruvate dehydrogenase E2 component (dihydrolipoamide acetyltransferase)